MGRSIAAIVAGYLVFGVSAFALFRLAGVDPHAPATGGFFLFAGGATWSQLAALILMAPAVVLGGAYRLRHE